MIYLNNDCTDYTTEDIFIDCHDPEERDELCKIWHKPDAEELYDYLDNLDAWDETDPSAFDQLADLCDVDDYDGRDDLMEKCAAAIEADK